MKPVKLPYPISFQELLRISVQTKPSKKTVREDAKAHPKPKATTQK